MLLSSQSMEAFFLLAPEARSRFLRRAARALGCVYICMWSYVPYPSNCLICMEGWFHEDGSNRLFDMYTASFWSVENGCVPGLAYTEGLPYVELADSDLINLTSTQVQRQFYQESGIKKAVFMGCKSGEIELGMSDMSNFNMQMIQQLFNEDLIQQSTQLPADNSHPSSSSSSLRSLSVGSPEYSSLLPSTQPISASIIPPHQMTMRAYNRQQNVLQFPTPASDDAALMRAMVAIISSSTPSTSSSAQYARPSPRQESAGRPLRAFKPYNTSLAPRNVEFRQRLRGQNMIKMGITILRNIHFTSRAEGKFQESRPPSTNQLHHMIAERKRREKLNESFNALRMLIPPLSKKDKASVLFHTRDYMNKLKQQISELEERTRMLELQLLPDDEIKEAGDSNERVQVEIIPAAESTSQVQRMALRIAVRVECNMNDLLLRVLECLKERGGVSLVSVNANTFSPSRGVHARLNLSLQVEAGDYDEQSLKEAVMRAVDGVVVARPQITNE